MSNIITSNIVSTVDLFARN